MLWPGPLSRSDSLHFISASANGPDDMAKVTGVGGIFFKSANPEKLAAWYRDELGVPVDGTYAAFEGPGITTWSVFAKDSDYFEPTSAPFMVNFRVDDLDGLLAQLRAHGVWVDERQEDYDYGRFGWVRDPEGNRIELWEPRS